MTKLTNESLHMFLEYPDGHDCKAMASELLSLRKLRDSAPVFNEEITRIGCSEWLAETQKGMSIIANHYEYQKSIGFSAGAKWQHSQYQLAYAALKAEYEKIKAEVERLKFLEESQPEACCGICTECQRRCLR